MFKSSKLFRGAVMLTGGQVASYAFSFARNVILARTLAKADFGLAAVFGMTISLLELAGRMSFGQQLVQSKDGNAERFQATSQAFQFVLAMASAALVCSMSYPVARAFHVPNATWAFATLAFVPLARGFENLDYYRQQRELNYLPAVLCDLVPQLIMTLAAWPLAVWLGNFSVIVWLMVGKACLGILMTHLMASRRYAWAWEPIYVKSMWAFGWPLLLNGLLMFGSQQADQVLVGAFLSLGELATYALALSLVSIPWLIFGQVASSVMLPLLSRVQDDLERFRFQYRRCLDHAAVMAVVIMLPLIIAGEQIVRIVYGQKYAGAGLPIAILGAASTVRFLRFAPAIASVARADTRNQLYSNICRCLSLPMAAGVAVLGGGVAGIASCALVAELLATSVSIYRLRVRQSVPMRDTAPAAIYVIGFLTAALLVRYWGMAHWGFYGLIASALAIQALALLAAWMAFPGFAHSVRGVVGRSSLAPAPQVAPDTLL